VTRFRAFTAGLRTTGRAALLALGAHAQAHPVTFTATITCSATQPAGAAASIANWTGASFDAANIGGSGKQPPAPRK
jgi:hypothetical protein